MAFLAEGKVNAKQEFRTTAQVSFSSTYNYYPVLSGNEFFLLYNSISSSLLEVLVFYKNNHLKKLKIAGRITFICD